MPNIISNIQVISKWYMSDINMQISTFKSRTFIVNHVNKLSEYIVQHNPFSTDTALLCFFFVISSFSSSNMSLINNITWSCIVLLQSCVSNTMNWLIIFSSLYAADHCKPLWKSNRILFWRKMIQYLVFIVCSRVHRWYSWGGQYPI